MGAHRLRTITLYCLMAVVGLFLAVFLLYPIGLTVRGGFAEDPAAGTGFTLAHLRTLFADPTSVAGLGNAFAIAAATTFLCVVIALPLAVLSAGYRFPGKGLLNAAILVPLILPPFVGAIGFKMLLGRQGAFNALLGTEWDILGNARFWGVVAVEALHLYPIIYLNALASIANLDPALDESAENLGAGRWRRFFRVTLPLIRPGLFAGGTIVFIWSFTELGTPLMFEFNRVTPVQIFLGLKEVEASAEPYAQTFVLLVSAALCYVVGKVVFGRRGHAMQTRASRSGGEARLGGLAGLVAAGVFGLVTLAAITPHIGVVLVSVAEPGSWYDSVLPKSFTGSHFVEALSADDSFTAIKNSLILSSLAVVVNLVAGVVVAYLVVRTKLKGRGLLDALCMLPLAVPGLVMAFGYVAMTLRWPFSSSSAYLFAADSANHSAVFDRCVNGIVAFLAVTPVFILAVLVRKLVRSQLVSTGLLAVGVLIVLASVVLRWPFAGLAVPELLAGLRNPLAGTLEVFGATPNPFPLLVIAYAVRRLPYIVRSASAGLEQTAGDLEDAAVNLGAHRVVAVWKVVLPLVAANLVAGAVLVFSFSMLEVSDSLILAQRAVDFPITKAIYEFSNRLGDGPYIASAMGVWGMGLLTITLVGASSLLGKKLGAIFRV